MRRVLVASVTLLALFVPARVSAQGVPQKTPDPAAPPAVSPDTPQTRTISGAVIDSATQQPVPGARVLIPGTSLETITDEQGFFVLENAPAGDLSLSVAKDGFLEAALTIGADQKSTWVSLQPGTTPTPAGRTITGKVVDEAGGPVPGAVVNVTGTEQTVMTDENGTFTLEGAPQKEVKLKVSGDTFADTTLTVALGVSEVEAKLSFEPTEQILITGRAPQIVRQNLANGSSRVDGKDLTRVTAQTVDDAMSGKVAGANIQRNSGAPGGGMQVSLRGVSTINAQSSPLYVIDGVIVSNVAIPSGISAVTGSTRGSNASSDQDNQVNRIADINPNDIENVEILKGASAAALYGSKAANGVVIITTKRGKRGDRPRVSVTQQVGLAVMSNSLGSRKFETVEEAVEAFGPNAANMFVEGQTYNHEKELFGRADVARETVASISGGLKNTSYFGSFLVRDEPGILHGTGYQKQSARVGFTQDFGERVTFGVSTNVLHADTSRGMTQNDNANVSHYMVLPSTPSFLNLKPGADGVFPRNPFVGPGTNPLQTVALMKDSEEIWRIIGALNANVRAIDTLEHGLTFNGTVGLDFFEQENDLMFPPDLYFEPEDKLAGTSLDGNHENRNLNANVSTSYRFSPAGKSWKSASTFGVAMEERRLDSLYVIARNLTAGLENVDAGTNVDLTENRVLVRERGAYAQEEVLLLDEKLALTAAVLAEQSSANGDSGALFFYPKGQVAYNFAKTGRFDTLRVRGSYGETGNQPLYGQKFTPYNARGAVEGLPTLTVAGRIGDPNIEPERQREFELGVDLAGYDDRVVVEATGYTKHISNLIMERATAPSTGFVTEFFNGGSMRNDGAELMLQVKPVVSKPFTWTSRTIFTKNKSKITSLPVPAFVSGGFGTGLGSFQIEEGASATQIVGNRPTADGGVEVVKLGDTEPDFRMSFVNNFDIGPFELGSLWDWQKGSDVINLTRLLYDLGSNTADFEENGMARLAAWDGGSNAAVYIEDASFLKLREVSLSYTLPEAAVKHLGPMNSARVSVSGRNLLTFSNYSGLDPEVSNFGNQPIGRNIDVAPYPASRSFWFSVTADF